MESSIRRRASMRIALAVVSSLLLLSCEELFFVPEPGTTPIEIFDQTWTFVDQEYSFFEYKGINWHDVRSEYRPRVTADMSDEHLFDLLAEMLYQLRDGHVNLKSDFDRSRHWQWYLDEQPHYDYSVLLRHYLMNEHQIAGPFLIHEFRSSGAPDSEAVGYVHYRSFGSAVSDADMDYLVERFDGYKGVIFDVRDNGGGSSGNAYRIAHRLTHRSVAVAESRRKVGPGHEEFGPVQTITLSPPDGASTLTSPVVVLTNRACYSATNLFVTLVKPLEHVTILGRRTGGGGGIPAFTFLSNGWRLRVSSTRLYALDASGERSMSDRNVEHGVEPDIYAESAESELALGVDGILDEAIAYIQGL